MAGSKRLINRDLYLNKLIAFKDSEIVKVVTGIRRCGKSTLLKLMVNHLKESGIEESQIIEMNFESYDFRKMNVDDFYKYVIDNSLQNKKMYLFFDELQRIAEWENAVNAFRVDLNCDIYITGSNAYMLSSEYSTYLSGRYVEIKMLPLSFKEFLSFHDFEIINSTSSIASKRKLFSKDGEKIELKDVFKQYLNYGGMPGITEIGFDQEQIFSLLESIYLTVVMRDILDRENRRGQRVLTDSFLLEKIIKFLADNIGSNISVSSIGNILVNEGLLTDGRNNKPSVHTVQAYVDALIESYFFYEIKRFDIKGKEFLRTLGKFYIVDIGLRNYLLGLRNRDSGHVIENIVYFELLKRGYDVSIGKIDNTEVDFIATKVDEKIYIQVTESMESEDIRKRELSPLIKIKDNYEKMILSLNPGLESSFDGIKSLNLIDWLLND